MSITDKRLYLNDSYLFEFESTVSEVIKQNDFFEVKLSQTAFYPESGGQLYDTGTIDNCQAISVYADDNNEVIHRCVDWKAVPGQNVIGKINRKRRLDNMRKHTGQHILSQSFLRVVSADTVGAHLGENESTIELALGELSENDLYAVEQTTNEIILRNLPVSISYHEFADLERLGVRRIPDRQGIFRLVGIGDFELTACGGTHCAFTGEVGILKIIGSEKIRNHIRVIFLCGSQAFDDYYQKSAVLDKLTKKLTCHFSDVNESISKITDQNEALRKQIAILNKELLPYQLHDLKENSEIISGRRLVRKGFDNQSIKEIKDMALNVTKSFDSIVLFDIEDKLIIASSSGIKMDASTLANLFMKNFEGKGGGNPAIAQVGGIPEDKMRRYLDDFVHMLKQELSG